jgi:hypothetical protein
VRNPSLGVFRLFGCAAISAVVLSLGACGGAPGQTGSDRSGTTRQALGSCGGQILTVAKATASSEQNNGHFAAAFAIDGDPTTRWSSNQGMPQWLQLDMGQVVFISELDINWQTAFSTSFEVQASNDGTRFGSVVFSGATQAGFQTIADLNLTARYLRIFSTGATGFGNVSIIDTQVVGDSNSACGSVESLCGDSVRLDATAAQASSTEQSFTPASNAIDEDYGTRWSSKFTDNEWLAVDLGTKSRVDSVRIVWQHAFAAKYAIQTGTSMTGPWTTVANVNGQIGAQTVPNIGATTRFLRMLGIKRSTSFGYSLYEFEVYGSNDTSCLLKGPWQFDAADTSMTPNTGFYTVTGNSIAIDFNGTSFNFGPTGDSNIVFQQPFTPVQGASYALTLNVNNTGTGPAIFSAFLAGAGAPVNTPPSGWIVDGSAGTLVMNFNVTSNPGTSPMLDLSLSGAFAGFCPGCNGGVGLATYTVGATLTRTH